MVLEIAWQRIMILKSSAVYFQNMVSAWLQYGDPFKIFAVRLFEKKITQGVIRARQANGVNRRLICVQPENILLCQAIELV